MATKSHLSRMTVDLPEDDHKRLKALAAVMGRSMRELIVEWVHEHLYGPDTPNEKTIEAIRQVERGENLVESDNLDDLFKKLGI